MITPPDFVGRDQELAALSRTIANRPVVVLVEGEAGIGKTRLVREFLAGPAGHESPVLVACCPPLRAPHTLGAVADAVRQLVRREAGSVADLELSSLAGALRPLFPEWADCLPPALEAAGDASLARHRVFCAVAELLERLAVRLLVVEDAHWSDEATLEFLLYLASSGPPAPVSLLVTCRPEDMAAGSLLRRLSRLAAGDGGLRLTLGPLGVAATGALVSSMLGGEAVSAEFAAFVHERTDGLPLAVEESIRLLGDRADLARRGDGLVRRGLDEIVVPPTIRDMVLERAARLGKDARAVLAAAAVIATPGDATMLAAVSGRAADEVGAGLGAALASGLLVQETDGRVTQVLFRHVLAARAVYEAIPVQERTAAHLRAARALEARSPASVTQLARHFREAGEAAEWCRYAEQAADLALAAGDGKTSALLLHDLLTHADLPTDSVVRMMRKIPFFSLDGHTHLSELARTLRLILSRPALTPAQGAELGSRLGRLLMSAGEFQVGAAELERAIPGLVHKPEAAKAMILLGWPNQGLRPAVVHRRWLDRAATALKDPSIPAGDRLQLAVNQATALLDMGEEAGWAAAAGLPADAATAREALQVASGYLNTGDAAMKWGRYEEARRRLTAALQLANQYSSTRMRDGALVTLVHLDWLMGAWGSLAGRALALADSDNFDPRGRLEAVLVAGLLDMVGGAHEAGEQRLRLVLDEGRRRGIVDMPLVPAAALARLRLDEGHPSDAIELTDEPMHVITRKGIWLWATETAPVRVQALAEAGRSGEAVKLVAAFTRGLRGRDLPAPLAALVTCRAILAQARDDHARAANLFGRAADAWAALPRPYAALLTQERQAHCLISAGAHDRGLPLLADVLHGLAGLEATADADRVTSTLREHGVAAPRGWRGGRRGYGNQLSPREIEVVRLVTAGHTNQQIARVLCRSAKTVDTQLTSAMRKLGVRSRTALAVRAIAAGVVAHGEMRGHADSPAVR